MNHSPRPQPAAQDDGSRIGLAIVVGVVAFVLGGAIGFEAVWFIVEKAIPVLMLIGGVGFVMGAFGRRRR
ncbi:hypothetical protein [Streptomyces sp. MJM1172]|uniref:hypothetical protein n=1 Tax=Streptomyces sp. MJM1172 TaxID=1703926 RepID=UPI00093913FC|nr:hypothetical protein [Streptomyces sp. MJM1172]OKI50311.1 hypothetical protein AMK15_32650 [Streptomyces sp. MJM1172]